MSVIGIWGNQADRLKPEQWVNVWLVDHDYQAEFFGTCQVKDLETFTEDSAPLEDFGLEPVDPEGNLILIKEAMR